MTVDEMIAACVALKHSGLGCRDMMVGDNPIAELLLIEGEIQIVLNGTGKNETTNN